MLAKCKASETGMPSVHYQIQGFPHCAYGHRVGSGYEWMEMKDKSCEREKTVEFQYDMFIYNHICKSELYNNNNTAAHV